MLRCLSLFSGIGGFDLAASAVGFQIVAFCEIDPFCQAVLHRHWPDVPLYPDVKEVSYAQLAQDGRLPIDLIYGGVPCQPSSLAGRRKGSRDSRWLWPEYLRVVGEVRPPWCLAENPVGILSVDDRRGFRAILGALVEMGYRCGWGVWGACDVGAPHRRERVFLLGSLEPAVADSCGDRQRNRSHQPERQSQCGSASDAGGCSDAVADTQGRETRWCGEPGLQSNAASSGVPPAMADAQSGQRQRRGNTWTGQSRSANDSDEMGDPSARDWKSGQASAQTVQRNARPLNELVMQSEHPTPFAQYLSADWVECLMGYPHGWSIPTGLPGRVTSSRRGSRPEPSPKG
jgi:DNA (cytosine-5)-methyltransferase 1